MIKVLVVSSKLPLPEAEITPTNCLNPVLSSSVDRPPTVKSQSSAIAQVNCPKIAVESPLPE